MSRQPFSCATLFLISVLQAACSGPGGPAPPDPVLDAMEPRVAERMREAREDVLRRPDAGRWGRLGSVYAAHELHEESEACYARARELDPDDFRWAYFLAIERAFNGAEADDVAERFAEAARLREGYAPLHVRWGRALAKRGRFEAAIDEFERALQIESGLVTARIDLGQAWLGLGDAARALAFLEPFVGPAGADARAALALSQAYRMLDRSADADRVAEIARRGVMRAAFADPVYEEWVEAEGISSSACYRRARRELAQGRHAEAIEDLLVVEEVDPGRAGVQAMLGSAYRGLGQRDSAIEHFSRAVELRDDQVWVRRQLAELYEQAGQLEKALEQYRGAIALDPREAAHYVAAVRVQSGLQDLSGAIATLQRGLEQRPADAGLHFLMGLAQRDAGRPTDALAEFQTVSRLEPQSARAYYQLGLTLERMGQPAEAAIYYREALAVDPGHEARKALDRLGLAR